MHLMNVKWQSQPTRGFVYTERTNLSRATPLKFTEKTLLLIPNLKPSEYLAML